MNVRVAGDRESVVNGVPLLDLKAQYSGLRDEIQSAIEEVCNSQWFVMGPKVTELEERVAAYSNVGFGIGVSSGTDALLVALMALDIGPGDEVLTTPFSFFATAGVVARLGARPVFCDIDPTSYNIDPDEIREFISSSCDVREGRLVNKLTGGVVRAIMPVHLFGQLADMTEVMAIANEFGLKVVEDAAQAIGAEDSDKRRAGSIGHIGCFSFFPSKNLGAFGDGGMCVTDDPDLAESLRVLRVHGGKPKYYHALIGGNFRLDALQAAVLLVKLKYLDGWSAARQANAGKYDELFGRLTANVEVPATTAGSRHIYNQYTIRVANRDGLIDHLRSMNIGNEVYYPVPLHLQKCFEYLGYKAGDCPQAEAAADSVLSIPIYPELTHEQIEHVARSVAEFVDAE